MRRGSRRRQNQRGFALLFIFAMAAAAAVMLYLELPRIAFEHQRNKEALLVERGEQYIRGLTLYYRKYNKFPQSLDELERADNTRYLRRRYKDPMTGKDEWRLIHVDAQGQFLDSLVHKPPGQEDEKKQRHLLEADVQGIGQSAVSTAEESQQGSPFLQRRASDRVIPNTPGGPVGQENQQNGEQRDDNPQDTARSPQPTVVPGESSPVNNPAAFLDPNRGSGPNPGAGIYASGNTGNLQQGGAGMQPLPFGNSPNSTGLPGSSRTQPGQSGQQGSSGGFGFSSGGFGMNAQTPPAGGTGRPGVSPQANPASGAATGSMGPTPTSPFGSPGFQQGSSMLGRPGMTSQGGGTMTSNPMSAIQASLSGQRPQTSGGGGLGGRPAGPTAGGIAGVASTLDMEGIRVYNERTNYKEWEFLFDLKKAAQAMANPGGGQAPMGQGNPGQQQQSGQGIFGQGGGFGQGMGSSGRGGQGQRPGFGQGGQTGTRPGGTGQSGFGQQPPPNRGGGFGFGNQSNPTAPGRR